MKRISNVVVTLTNVVRYQTVNTHIPTSSPVTITETAADGSTVALADYAGEPVLLYFHMAVG